MIKLRNKCVFAGVSFKGWGLSEVIKKPKVRKLKGVGAVFGL